MSTPTDTSSTPLLFAHSSSLSQTGGYFPPNAADVPVEPRGQPNALVQKSVRLVELQPFIAEHPNDDATRLRAQINCQIACTHAAYGKHLQAGNQLISRVGEAVHSTYN